MKTGSEMRGWWRFEGELARGPFLSWAVVLMGLKAAMDVGVLRWFGWKDWSWVSYLIQPVPDFVEAAIRMGPTVAVPMLVLSVPFLWMGCALCVCRLRSAGLSVWWVGLFAVPVLKLFLFLALILVPPVAGGVERGMVAGSGGRWTRRLPESRFGSATVSILVSVLVSCGSVALGTLVLRNYGWGLFVGVPFVIGFVAAVMHGMHRPRTLLESLIVAGLAVGVAGGGLLLAAFEGILCLIMAAPLALGLGLVGGALGYTVQGGRWRRSSLEAGCFVPLLALPVMLGTEVFREGPPPLLRVSTSVRVAAPPSVVWRHVVAFAELPPPRELIFKLGIAYPMRAEIEGQGVGAVRRCVFSTGPFVEPIEVWDEPRLLRFGVTANPAPMEEWTPYDEVHPPHLEGFLVSRRGQFRLEATSEGGTLLEGTTWYHHSLWPAPYWQWWSDGIIHTIHRRVLEHVKGLAEGTATGGMPNGTRGDG